MSSIIILSDADADYMYDLGYAIISHRSLNFGLFVPKFLPISAHFTSDFALYRTCKDDKVNTLFSFDHSDLFEGWLTPYTM